MDRARRSRPARADAETGGGTVHLVDKQELLGSVWPDTFWKKHAYTNNRESAESSWATAAGIRS